MIHQANSGTVAQSGSLQATIGGQTVGGILVTGAAAHNSDDTLSVVLKSKLHPAVVLVNGLSARVLADLSDIEGGFSQGAQQSVATGTAISGLQTIFPFLVKLGCLHMRANESELEVIYRKGTTTASGAVSMATVIDELDTDHYFQYVESRDSRERFEGVDRVWAISNADLLTMTTKVARFMVTGPEGSHTSDMYDVLGLTMAARGAEFSAPKRLVELYRSTDDIPDDVEVQVTGTDASSFTFLARQVVHDKGRVSRGTIAAAQRYDAKMANMPADRRSALVRAGKLPDHATLRRNMLRLNTGVK